MDRSSPAEMALNNNMRFGGMTLKALLENPDLQHAPTALSGGELIQSFFSLILSSMQSLTELVYIQMTRLFYIHSRPSHSVC